MPTVYLDQLQTLEMEERYGVTWALKRLVRVADLTQQDFRVLSQALTDAGVPTAGSSPTGFPELILINRRAALIEGETTKVDVFLDYERFGTRPENTPNGFVYRGRGALSEIHTALDRRPGVNYGKPLPALCHTFPETDIDEELRSQTICVVPEVDYLGPQDEFEASGILPSNTPGLLAQQWRGHVNDAMWNGQPAGNWLCTNVGFDAFDLAVNPWLWIFTFQFQLHVDGWDPDVVFIDARHGKPPPDLVANYGYTTLTNWYPRKNFAELFPP